MKNRHQDSNINNNGGESAPMRISLGTQEGNKQQEIRASGWQANNGAATTNNPTSGAGLNSSFSAMNNSLSQKWMNKKNQIGAGVTQQPLNAA